MAGDGSGDPDPDLATFSPPPDSPTTDYGFLDDALDRTGAAGFVAVGDPHDADVRYLSRVSGPAADAPLGFVYAGGDPVLVVSGPLDRRAVRAFPGRVERTAADDSPGRRAASLLSDLTDGGSVLVPRDVPHDAAVYLERAGFGPTSTAAAADARARKTDAERACLQFAASAAERGMARAAAVLSAAESADAAAGGADELRWADAPLSPERLRREIDAAVARAGVESAGDTAVRAGPPADADADERAPDAPLRPGETAVVDLSPRGPHGYRSTLARTFVVAGSGGWERRAHVAVTAAARAGLDEVEPGTPARRVREEVVAELAAHGFDAGVGSDADTDTDADADDDGDLFGSPGHGIGLSRREAPSLRGDGELEPGHVLTVGAGLADPDGGAVRVADAVAVTEEGRDVLTSFPASLSPSA